MEKYGISKKVVSILEKREYISKEDEEIYLYGYHIIFESILDFMILMVIGILLHQFVSMCLYIAVFCLVRQQAGGYHADRRWKCRLISILICVVGVVFASQILLIGKSVAQAVIMTELVLSDNLIILYAPVIYEGKKFDAYQRNDAKKKCQLIVAVVTILCLVLMFVKPSLSCVIGNALLTVAALMIVQISHNNKREQNMQKDCMLGCMQERRSK